MGLHLMQPAIFAALLLRPLLHVHEQQQQHLSAVRCDAPVALAAKAKKKAGAKKAPSKGGGFGGAPKANGKANGKAHPAALGQAGKALSVRDFLKAGASAG